MAQLLNTTITGDLTKKVEENSTTTLKYYTYENEVLTPGTIPIAVGSGGL